MVKFDWLRLEIELEKRDITHEDMARRLGMKLETFQKYVITGRASLWAVNKMAAELKIDVFDLIRRR